MWQRLHLRPWRWRTKTIEVDRLLPTNERVTSNFDVLDRLVDPIP